MSGTRGKARLPAGKRKKELSNNIFFLNIKGKKEKRSKSSYLYRKCSPRCRFFSTRSVDLGIVVTFVGHGRTFHPGLEEEQSKLNILNCLSKSGLQMRVSVIDKARVQKCFKQWPHRK